MRQPWINKVFFFFFFFNKVNRFNRRVLVIATIF